jgi:hypothetical protein
VGRGLDEASFVDGRIGHCAKDRRVVPLGGEERTRPHVRNKGPIGAEQTATSANLRSGPCIPTTTRPSPSESQFPFWKVRTYRRLIQHDTLTPLRSTFSGWALCPLLAAHPRAFRPSAFTPQLIRSFSTYYHPVPQLALGPQSVPGFTIPMQIALFVRLTLCQSLLFVFLSSDSSIPPGTVHSSGSVSFFHPKR